MKKRGTKRCPKALADPQGGETHASWRLTALRGAPRAGNCLQSPQSEHTLRRSGAAATLHTTCMLEHLIYHPEVVPDVDGATFTPEARADSSQLFDAKVGTTDVFTDLGVVDDDIVEQRMSEEQAGRAFSAYIGDDEQKRLAAVGALTLPSSVKASVAMLTNYQWNFVSQAAELRSMTVSKIVKETDHPDARIRLSALRMLGSVTEVALFTERIEVKKVAQDPTEIEALIREKLAKFAALAAPPAQEVEDAVVLEAQCDALGSR